MDGGPGNDALSGGPGLDAVAYANAPAAVRVDLGRDRGIGWGTDRLSGIETVLSSRFADSLLGDGGRNHLAGFRRNDRLTGSGDNDLLDGGPGTDFVDGGAGADLCIRAERSVRCP